MDCFIYITAAGELNYCVGRAEVRGSMCFFNLLGMRYSLVFTPLKLQATTMCYLRRPMSLMVCPANRSRVYLMDEEFK